LTGVLCGLTTTTKGDTMLTCASFEDCTEQVTGVIILTHDEEPALGTEVIAHCDGHAPEVMHELITDGYDRTQMVTCTINERIVQYLPDDTVMFGPRTLADNIGRRVELQPHLDRWMQGDRYGTIVGVHGIKYTVKLDTSGDVAIFTESEVRFMPTVRLVK
jgi:hypothetical protein